MSVSNKGFFITGTDTGVGKTWVATGLLAAIGAQGHATAAMKPVASGCTDTTYGLRNDDAVLLMRHASLVLPYEQVNPYAFAAPVAPHIAAAATARSIEIAHIKAVFDNIARQADYVIVEGIGGWKVPLDDRQTTADLAVAVGLPVILVVGIRLGCLNHALLSVDSIVSSGLTLAGWVANAIESDFAAFEQNVQGLRTRIAAPCLGIISNLPCCDTEQIGKLLDVNKLLAQPGLE